MKRLLFLLLLAGPAALAQVFTIETISRADDAYHFPKIHSSQHPEAAKKMNALILTNFGSDPKHPSPYDSIQFEDEYYFEVGTVNDRIVSLTTYGVHSGCGHHETKTNYVFDVAGALVDMGKVFGAQGYLKLKNALHKLWIESIKPLVDDEIFAQDYKDCLARAQSDPDIYIDRMLVLDGGMKFDAGYCLDGSSSQQDRAKGPFELSLGQLLPMLTPYGLTLFVDKPSGPMQTLMRGTIDGKYPISLVLLPHTQADFISGMIVYDRIGQPIKINGTRTGNQITFHELDEKTLPLSTIEVSWDGKKLTGSFTNLKTKKQMPFVAERVNGG